MIKNTKNNQGFTLIEVLIVLAIASLIILIVFFAIPALKRNARNLQRRSDATHVIQGIKKYIKSNAAMPSTGALGAGGSTATIGESGNTTSIKLKFYTADNVSIVGWAVNVPALLAVDKMEVVTGAACEGNAVVASSSSNSFAVIYMAEPSTIYCLSS